MYDAVIIGSGPAGLSAAINLKLHEKDFIWFGSRDYSDKVEKSEKIANYPGLGLIPGAELNARFDAHAKEMGLEPVDKKVTNVMPADGYLMVLAENEKSASGASLKNEQAAADYMRAFGEADAAQLSCTPVTIPADFDAVYEEYNGLQLQNGHDLRNYKGKTAWQYIFSLAHHDASYAVLLVRDGAVIGGHLTNGEYGGDYLPLE